MNDEEPMDKKKIEGILIVLFFICMIILVIYSIKVSNDYNELVSQCNELRRNISRSLFLDFNQTGGLIKWN